MSDLPLAVLVYTATVLSSALLILDSRCMRRRRDVRRTRRTTRQIWARTPFSRPAQRPHSRANPTILPAEGESSPEPPRRRQAS
jgi:hypothetical protein